MGKFKGLEGSHYHKKAERIKTKIKNSKTVLS